MEEEDKTILHDQNKGNPVSLYEIDDQLFRERKLNKINTEDKEYKLVCKYIYDIDNDEIDEEDKKQCINFATCEGFCNKHFREIENKTSTEDGDQSENYIFELLEESDEFSKVTMNGRENSELDIIFIVKGETEERGIQIKTLYKLAPRKFDFGGLDNYNQNT